MVNVLDGASEDLQKAVAWAEDDAKRYQDLLGQKLSREAMFVLTQNYVQVLYLMRAVTALVERTEALEGAVATLIETVDPEGSAEIYAAIEKVKDLNEDIEDDDLVAAVHAMMTPRSTEEH